MLRILAPIDGSPNTDRVIDYLISLADKSRDMEVVLINVRDAMDSPQVHRFWSAEKIHEFQQQEGGLTLTDARNRLDAAGVRHTAEVVIGDIAPAIAGHAKTRACDMIVMGTRGKGSLGRLLMGSVASEVVHLAAVPVTLVK